MRENIIEQLRFCASRFSCEGCIGECKTGSNEPRTKAVLNDAADAIEELLAAVPHWISVEDELPEKDMPLLCYYEYFRYGDYNCMFDAIDRGYFYNGRFGGISGDKLKVKYWMPLPEPPKGVE